MIDTDQLVLVHMGSTRFHGLKVFKYSYHHKCMHGLNLVIMLAL